MSLNPYLGFAGEARAAFTFYQSVLGGELTIGTFAESGMDAEHPDHVMHADLSTSDGFRIMGADMNKTVADGHAVTINGTADAGARLTEIWEGLSEGGSVLFPLAEAPWGGHFGQFVDRFGLTWMIAYDA